MKKRILGIILIMSMIMSNLVYAKVTIDFGDSTAESSSASTKQNTTTKQKETQASANQKQSQTQSSITNTQQIQAQQKAQAEALAQQQALLQQQIALQQAQLEAMNKQYTQDLQAFKDENGIKRGWEYSNLLHSWIFYDMLGNVVKDNWVDYNNQRYYMNDDGTMATGWKKIGSKWYYFNKNGDMRYGWLQDGNDWYYLSPLDNGAMQTGDVLIDGEFHMFLASGKWVDNIESHETNELATVVLAMINYVNDSKKLKVVKSPDRELKENVETIIKNLPRDVLQRMVESVKAIYICTEDADGYIFEESYKDEDNTSQRVQIPYNYQGHSIYMCGDVRNLYSGIGLFIARTYMISDRKIWNTKTWQQLYEDTEERDNAYAISFNTYRVYPESREQCLASLIGYYMIDRWDLQETCPSYYKYIATYCNIGGGLKSPLVDKLK